MQYYNFTLLFSLFHSLSPLFLSIVHFGSVQLSSNGRHLLYVAEREKPKSCSFFKKQEKKKNEEDEDNSQPVPVSEGVVSQCLMKLVRLHLLHHQISFSLHSHNLGATPSTYERWSGQLPVVDMFCSTSKCGTTKRVRT